MCYIILVAEQKGVTLMFRAFVRVRHEHLDVFLQTEVEGVLHACINRYNLNQDKLYVIPFDELVGAMPADVFIELLSDAQIATPSREIVADIKQRISELGFAIEKKRFRISVTVRDDDASDSLFVP